MSDDFPAPGLIYDRRILVDGSMVYVAEKGIVLGVAVSGDFPNGIVIGQQLPLTNRLELEYLKQGITDHALIVALWEKLMENKPDSASSLQSIKAKVDRDTYDLVP